MIERPLLPLPGVGDFFRDLGGHPLVNGFVAFIFAATGPVAIILAVGGGGGLTERDLASWVFACFVVGGAISVLFSILWRQPIAFMWTIPGTVLVGPALAHLSFPEVIGAFLATGVLMAVLALTGLVRRGMALVPMPVVMGMVAGVFLRFGLDLVNAFREGLAIALPMTLVFVALSASSRLGRIMPPMIGALVAGVLAIAVTGGMQPGFGAELVLQGPTFYRPVFSLQAMAELVLPIAITVLVVQNAQGFAILKSAGHNPPINAATLACGLGSLVSGLMGSVSVCVTGPSNAIIASSGARQRQWTGGVWFGVLGIVFGIFASVATRAMLATPPAFVAVLGGLAMLRVLQTAFVAAFSGRFTLGALVTFIVTVSDVSIVNIGAPFWGLIIGFAISWILEREDFRTLRADARDDGNDGD